MTMTIDHDDDYDNADSDVEAVDVDETETVSTDVGGGDSAEEVPSLTDADLAEAESLTVTAKQSIRQQLEDEVARFLAQGGKITEVPADESLRE
ncbi:hypothetical protein BKE30_10235 [Alkanindiges hydrocarboniclasticus]|uniref:Transcriptional regulator SutA RNAP-binding domain-containing protein n=1 Tax=Alkanindiges hydrocarboniclasticus TaxID=1907941 RepID=A0A1S8CUI1_9GAMM|nr:hypothetical protein [Alkanindiges hydrocarboniclasticus]ONG39140.1 hypothetical protein BKE30_10235 [Alkanindiges hydrocarboniclasticus]